MSRSPRGQQFLPIFGQPVAEADHAQETPCRACGRVVRLKARIGRTDHFECQECGLVFEVMAFGGPRAARGGDVE